jgi:hypothetical protein
MRKPNTAEVSIILKAIEESRKDIRMQLSAAFEAVREKADSYDNLLDGALSILSGVSDNLAKIVEALSQGDRLEANRLVRDAAAYCHILSLFGKALQPPRPVDWSLMKPRLLSIIQFRMEEIDRELDEIKQALEGQS